MTLPLSWTLVPVTGQYVARDGAPVSGRLRFTGTQSVSIDGVQIVPRDITVRLTADGAIPEGFALPSTDDPDLSVGGWAYTVREEWPGGRDPWQLVVPHDAVSLSLPDALPAVASSELAPFSAAAIAFSPAGTGMTATTVQAAIVEAAGSGGGEGQGARGYSAYEIAVQQGYSGTLSQWLASLVGEDGAQGAQGTQGPAGATGPQGEQGPPGIGLADPIPYIGTPTAESLRDALVAAGLMLAAAPTAPGNTTAPVASGASYPGETLTTTNGSWTGNPTSISYVWQRNVSGTWTAVPGATSASYVVEQAGQYRSGVSATNAVGSSAYSYSAPVSIAAEPQAPENTTAPAISGGTAAGATITVSNGTWAHAPTTYSYAWEQDTGAGWTAVSGATTNAITAGAAGTQYRATVTATNATGSTSATSAAHAIVGPVPVVAMAPSLLGDPVPGATITSNNGMWDQTPGSYIYGWQEWNGTAWVNIADQTANTYVPPAAMRIRSVVRAVNEWGGSLPSYSNAIDIAEAYDGAMAWLGGFNTTRAGSQSVSDAPQNYAQSWGSVIPPNSYFELQVNETQPHNRVGVWPFAGTTPSNPGEWGDLGQGGLSHCFGLAADGEWSNHAFYNGTWVDSNTPNNDIEPARRWGFYVDGARGLWVRQVWPGGESAYYNSEQPVCTFPGTDPLHIAHSAMIGLGALIIAPEEHYGSLPDGATRI